MVSFLKIGLWQSLSQFKKKGIKDNPFNYRGIAISSNVCKLFNRIMNCRLNNFCVKTEYYMSRTNWIL